MSGRFVLGEELREIWQGLYQLRNVQLLSDFDQKVSVLTARQRFDQLIEKVEQLSADELFAVCNNVGNVAMETFADEACNRVEQNDAQREYIANLAAAYGGTVDFYLNSDIELFRVYAEMFKECSDERLNVAVGNIGLTQKELVIEVIAIADILKNVKLPYEDLVIDIKFLVKVWCFWRALNEECCKPADEK